MAEARQAAVFCVGGPFPALKAPCVFAGRDGRQIQGRFVPPPSRPALALSLVVGTLERFDGHVRVVFLPISSTNHDHADHTRKWPAPHAHMGVCAVHTCAPVALVLEVLVGTLLCWSG